MRIAVELSELCCRWRCSRGIVLCKRRTSLKDAKGAISIPTEKNCLDCISNVGPHKNVCGKALW